MDTKQFIDQLAQKIPTGAIRENEPMSAHTSFKIGGPAKVFVSPENELQLKSIINLCKEQNLPYYIIGNGSNLLVTDEGIEGVVIELCRQFSNIKVEGTQIEAYAGALLSKIAYIALENQLTGLEFAHGIPGTVGGAVTMNAGAYGKEMKDVLVSAVIMDDKGNIKEFTAKELELGYRTSIIQKRGYIILKARFELEFGQKQQIEAQMKELMQRRKDKQPLEFPSAGSTFKRPEGHFAGKLIMDSGLKGYKIGGACVSEKHCGFIINENKATYQDVMALISHVQRVVKEKYGVMLEPEVKIIKQ